MCFVGGRDVGFGVWGESLWAVLGSIPDRRGLRGRRCPLRSVSVLTLAAMLTGANDLRAAFRWGRRLPDEALSVSGLSRAPCHATYRYFFKALDVAAAALGIVLRWTASVCAGARPGVMTGARAFTWRLPLPAIRVLRLGSCGSGRRTTRRRRRCRCSRACRSRARRSPGMPRFAGAPYARPSATAAVTVRLPLRPTNRPRWPTSPKSFGDAYPPCAERGAG